MKQIKLSGRERAVLREQADYKIRPVAPGTLLSEAVSHRQALE